MKIEVLDNADEVADEAAAIIADRGQDRGHGARPLRHRRQRRPHAVGDAACAGAAASAWDSVHLFQVDERVAPPAIPTAT